MVECAIRGGKGEELERVKGVLCNFCILFALQCGFCGGGRKGIGFCASYNRREGTLQKNEYLSPPLFS